MKRSKRTVGYVRRNVIPKIDQSNSDNMGKRFLIPHPLLLEQFLFIFVFIIHWQTKNEVTFLSYFSHQT